MTAKGRQDLAAVIAEMRAWAGPESEWDQNDATPQQVLTWADRLALLLAEAHPQDQEKEGVTTRMDRRTS